MQIAVFCMFTIAPVLILLIGLLIKMCLTNHTVYTHSLEMWLRCSDSLHSMTVLAKHGLYVVVICIPIHDHLILVIKLWVLLCGGKSYHGCLLLLVNYSISHRMHFLPQQSYPLSCWIFTVWKKEYLRY